MKRINLSIFQLNAILIAIVALAVVFMAFTQNPQSGAIYCQIGETSVNNTIKIQMAGDIKGATLIDDNGSNVKDLPYALQVMDARGWRVVESYSGGSDMFPTVTIIMRKE